MRKALAALALAGSSVAFAEHKAFQEKYIIGCSTEQIATANSITDSFRTCALDYDTIQSFFCAFAYEEEDSYEYAPDVNTDSSSSSSYEPWDPYEEQDNTKMYIGGGALVLAAIGAFLYSRSGGAQPVVSAMDEDEMAMARKKEGGLMAADDADEI